MMLKRGVRMKKADLSMNIIIIAAILMIIFVVILMIFSGRMKIFTGGLKDCYSIKNADCVAATECNGEWQSINRQYDCSGEKEVCCITITPTIPGSDTQTGTSAGASGSTNPINP